MHITFVIPSLDVRNDERCALGLLSRLSTDHALSVVTGEADQAALPRSFRVKVLPTLHRPFPAIARYLSFLIANSLYFMVRRRSTQPRDEIIHATGGDCFFADVMTSNYCQAERLALSKAGGIEIESKGRWGKLDIWLQKVYMRVVARIEEVMYAGRRPRVVIAVSPGLRENIRRHYGRDAGRTVVIPNAVDLNRFHPERRRDQGSRLRKELGYERDDFVLIFLGGDWGRKGLRFAIEALSFLRDTPAKLLVIGRGEHTKYARLVESVGVENRVLFAGFRSDPEACYGAADCFVAPSGYEACSIAMLEAAATGLPLICTRINGSEEMIQDGVNGFFVEPSGRDIARKVRLLISDRDGALAMGRAARATVASNYSWDQLVERTLEVYGTILSDAERNRKADLHSLVGK